MTSTYQNRIAQGLCGRCGVPAEGKSLCPACAEQSRKKAAEKRQRLTAEKRCITCGVRVERGTRCAACKEKNAMALSAKRKQRREAGLCQVCGAAPKPGCTLCQACIDKLSRRSSENYRKRKAAGTCCYCSRKPLPGLSVCEYHQQKYDEYRRKLRLEVLDAYGGPVCALCGDDRVDALAIDHVDGGGRTHFRQENIRGSADFYLWLKRNGFPPGFRVLCATCNVLAHREKTKRCP